MVRSTFVVALLFLLTSPAFAAVEVGNSIQLSLWNKRPGDQQYGPYVATIKDGPNEIANALVFCVEQKEYFSPNATYQIQNISEVTNHSGHTLSGYTAWIYTTFAERYPISPSIMFPGTGPAGLTFNGNAVTWGQVSNAFQNAIWAGMINLTDAGRSEILEGDIGLNNDRAEKAVDLDGGTADTIYEVLGISLQHFLASDWGATTDRTEKLNYTGNIRVLNIGTSSNGHVQDQIFIFPPDTTTNNNPTVPEPASIVATGVLFGLFASCYFFRQRFSRSAVKA